MAKVSTRPSVTFVINLNTEEVGLICDAICRPVGSQHHNDESPAYRQMREDLHRSENGTCGGFGSRLKTELINE